MKEQGRGPAARAMSSVALTAPRSGIRDVFERAEAVPHVISLAIGEPSESAPAHVVRAGCAAIEEGRTRYTDVLGIPEYRRAVSEYSRRTKGLVYDPEREVQATPGATLGIYMALRVLLDPGDEVIVCSPGFTSYGAQVMLCQGRVVEVPLRPENGMRMDADDVARAITSRTKAVIVNSPGNPTGAVTPAAELARIAQVCLEHGVWAISDEVYHPFVFPDREGAGAGSAPSIAAVPGMRDRTIVIDSLSKTYAMTGWRIGYLLAPAHVVAETSKVAEQINSSNNAPAQYAGVAALDGLQDQVVRMREEYARKREVVVAAVQACPALSMMPPGGAFYAFVDVRGTGLGSEEFAARLLAEEAVAVVPGEAFGEAGRGFVRVSYAGDAAELGEGVRRLVAFAGRAALDHGGAGPALPAVPSVA